MHVRSLAILVLLAGTAFAQTRSAAGLEWRSIGPAAMSGRIADLAISQTAGAPAVIYVATTSGGIFKSVNEGVSFTPVFDRAGGMMSMGAVAVSASNPNVVWAGTGEADNRQSSSWGDGVYKSVDGGLTWEKKGLADSRHVGKILIHPADPETVYVAAVGHLWGSNAERGVFKTTDGGRSWKKVLYRDEHTGAIDLVMDAQNPEIVYAAMYQRQRKGWGFNGGGPGSGIFRTSDGGATWTELNGGLPAGAKGRIGLASFETDSRILYAVVEADMLGEGSAVSTLPRGGVYRSQDRGESWEQMSGLNPRPVYYSRIYVDPKDSRRVYLMGSNRGFFVSDDSGRSFREGLSGVHGEDHVLWVNPRNTNHLVVGGDGGVSISFDRGLTWLFRMNLPLGQFYNIATNNADPYLVCGGLQDNGSWCTPSATRVSYGISYRDTFNIGSGDGMHALFEGDDHTMLVSSQNGVTGRLDLRTMQRQQVGPVQPEQKPKPGEPGYRWYWTTPLVVSKFAAATIYTGANVVFRSTDKGVSWKAISPDLTGNVDRDKLEMMGAPVPARAFSRHDGQTNFSALTVIAESPMDRNLLYTGSDDGRVQVTRDGGAHWTDVTANVKGLPPMLNISGIAPSKFAAGRVYLTVDGHFNDDYRPYVFRSEDYGQTWQPVVSGLPQASVHRIREHPGNADFLVVGTEMGAWASFDRGASWTTLNTSMPPVPVYDLVFQEKEHALVLGTHGRSIWILDHIEPLEQMSGAAVLTGNKLFPVPPVHHELIYNGQFWFGQGEFFAPNPPAGAVITYSLTQPAQEVRIAIADAAGQTVRAFRGPVAAGLNRVCWDLRLAVAGAAPGGLPMGTCAAPGYSEDRRPGGPVVLPGKYTATVSVNGAPPMMTEITVQPDPAFPITDGDRAKRQTSIMSAYRLQEQLAPAGVALSDLSKQLAAMREYLRAAGDTGRAGLEQVSKAETAVRDAQTALGRTLGAARNVQNAMDSYAGLPTAAQLRSVEWAWEDAAANVAAINRISGEAMPGIYTVLGSSVLWPRIAAVRAPVR